MTRRTTLATLPLLCLLFSPAVASQPAGLAAKLITDLGDCDQIGLPPPQNSHTFQWYEAFDVRTLEPSDTVTVTMALIPFQTGLTLLTFDDKFGQNFGALEFSDELVGGLHYDRYRWNDVTVELHPATQDFTLTVNGVRAGPFPFATLCQDAGGCFSMQSFHVFGFSNGDGSVAWVDSVSVSRDSAAGQEIFDALTFDACEARPYVTGGAILITTPPQRRLQR